MKYTSTNKPLECMMTQSSCYQGTTKMQIKGILWHSTGVNNSNLSRYVQPDDNAPNRDELLKIIGVNKYGNDWNHISRSAGVNAWIGKLADGSVSTVQTLPWDYRPWGCGKGTYGSCNDGWIQFEICEDDLLNGPYFEKIYKEACELTAYLCVLFNIDPEGTTTLNGVTVPTILCHRDAHALGVGSNHSDVIHWFSWYNKTMANARADVKALIPKPEPVVVKQMYRVRKSANDAKSQKGAYTNLESAKSCCQAAGEGYHVFDSSWTIVYSYVAPEIIELTRIEIDSLPNKTLYHVGEKLDTTGMVVKAIYSNGTADEIEEYTIEGFDSTNPGLCQVKVIFENCITAFDITIKEAPQPLTPVDPEPITPEPQPNPVEPKENKNFINTIMKFIVKIVETVINFFKKGEK